MALSAEFRGATITDSIAGIELLGLDIAAHFVLLRPRLPQRLLRHAMLDAVGVSRSRGFAARFRFPRPPQIDDLSHCPLPVHARAPVFPTSASDNRPRPRVWPEGRRHRKTRPRRRPAHRLR